MIDEQKDFDRAKRSHIARSRYDIQRRAKKKDIPFDLTTKYLIAIAPDNCPVFKVPLKWGYGGNGSASNESPSLDRIFPEKGYVKGNVAWICHKANMIKSTGTEVDLYAVADWLHKKRKEVLSGGARPPSMDDPAFTYITRPAYTRVVSDQAARDRGGY
tara:strand:+ start:457 stop:933 length:477 start_codon:yes stop_codon:yes gene_type:complete